MTVWTDSSARTGAGRAYLDAGVRGPMSTFTKIGDVEPGLARLRADLEDGTWTCRYAHLMSDPATDLGYRLVIARGRGGPS
jgi:hypothetical protein